jgi:magnesium transporter
MMMSSPPPWEPVGLEQSLALPNTAPDASVPAPLEAPFPVERDASSASPASTPEPDYEERLRQDRETLRDIIAGRVREHIFRKQPRFTLRQYLNTLHFADIADAMEHELEPIEGVQCLEVVTPTLGANILISLEGDTLHYMVNHLTPTRLLRIIRAMPNDDAVDILQEVTPEDARRILGELPQDADTKSLIELFIEAPDTAAGIMSPHFMCVPLDATVADALNRVKEAHETDFVYYTYLVDDKKRLAGVVSIKTLLINSDAPERALGDIALVEELKSVHEEFDQELVANIFRKYYNLLALPVVDDDHVLMGIITFDDVIDVIDEENQEDIYRASGIRVEEAKDERNLLTGKSWYAVRARIPWLSVTLVGQLLVATIIGMFNSTVSQSVAAVSFLPLLCGLAGNVGTQSDTISVRGIALEMIHPENVQRQVFREIRVALMIGGLFALVLGSASYLMYHHALLSLILVGYVVASNCVSAAMGIIIPYSIKYIFKQDPAGIGGPFITTGMDLLMYSTYLYLLSRFHSAMI